MSDITIDRGFKWYSTKEPIIVLLLSALAIASFVAVDGLSRIYHARQNAVANEFYTRGAADLKAGQLDRAISEFRAALLYSRDNFSYQLSIAQALVARHRLDEAYAYLINLRQREPENGPVNLELGRIFAAKDETTEASRYYHNAVYAVWDGTAQSQRRVVRLELIDFLLRANLKPQAEAELIALAASLPEDASLQARVGDLFMEAQDYEHALAEYHLSLKLDRHNAAAITGGGRAAFQLGRYAEAQHYLQEAVAANPNDADSRAFLQTTSLVLQMDPFRRQISTSRRDQAVIDAFVTAGDRLKACPLPTESPSAASSPPETLDAKWTQMQPQVNAHGLRRDPDLANAAMDLVFTIEQRMNAQCGTPTGKDLALLLISRLREGN